MNIDRRARPEEMNTRRAKSDIIKNEENILGYAKNSKFHLIDNISVFIFPELRELLISLTPKQIEEFKEKENYEVLAIIRDLLVEKYLLS